MWQHGLKTQGLSCLGSSSTGCLIWKLIIKGLKVQRAGLHIGEFKKQRFEPSHSLALALKLNDAKNLVSLHVTIRRQQAFSMVSQSCYLMSRRLNAKRAGHLYV